MTPTNKKLAALFEQMAALLQITGANRFRIVAYDRAARALEDLQQDVAEMSREQLLKVEGIGKGMVEHIENYVQQGCVEELETLKQEIPPKLPELLNVPGLGPKTVAKLWKEVEITSLEDLHRAIESGELEQLQGFGAKKLENLKKSLTFIEKSGKRMLLGQARPLAQWLVDRLGKTTGVQQITYAGSLRRGKETIGDIDILVAAENQHAQAIADAFKTLAQGEVIASGKTKTSVQLDRGTNVDLRIVTPESYGAALMYFTGSKEHNVRLRQRAINQGMTLNEYGLYKQGDEKGKPVASETEQAVYQALGLSWIPPELREDHQEIARAEAGELPKLIGTADIHAELHAHTNASDGLCTLRELVQLAVDRGFHTLAVTDHSKSQVQANGLSAKRLESHIQAIREIAETFKDRITVLAGSEVDILSDGSLDYPNALLKQLDLVVASPHAALTQEPNKATTRLLKAIENPYVTILGHPTGRLVGRREGVSPDMTALVKAAAARGIAMEINSNPHRLDLRDSHALMAIEAGVKLAINTDAHGPDDLNLLVYGVLTARRAGATAADVINTMDRDALQKWIASTRR